MLLCLPVRLPILTFGTEPSSPRPTSTLAHTRTLSQTYFCKWHPLVCYESLCLEQASALPTPFCFRSYTSTSTITCISLYMPSERCDTLSFRRHTTHASLSVLGGTLARAWPRPCCIVLDRCGRTAAVRQVRKESQHVSKLDLCRVGVVCLRLDSDEPIHMTCWGCLV